MSEQTDKTQAPSAQEPNAADAWHAANPERVNAAMDKTGGWATFEEYNEEFDYTTVTQIRFSDAHENPLTGKMGRWIKEYDHAGPLERQWRLSDDEVSNHTARCVNESALKERLEAMDIDGLRVAPVNKWIVFRGKRGNHEQVLTRDGWEGGDEAGALFPTLIEALVCAAEALPENPEPVEGEGATK